MSCVVCHSTEAPAMVRLVPCQHQLCKDCFQSPLVLVSCYGCPACGSAPSSTVEEVAEVKGDKEMEEVVESLSCYHDAISAAFFPTYSPTYTATQDIPVAAAVRQVDLSAMIPTFEAAVIDTCDEEDGFAHFANTDYLSVIVAAANDEEEDGDSTDCGVSTSGNTAVDCSTSNASSETKKRRRQKKSKKNPTHADRFATPKKPKVVVPAGCPDHLRPRTRPEPTTFREVGRHHDREFMLKKIAKGKAHSMHVVKKHCNHMTCF